MTDTKDMGVFGFGKEEDWKGYAIIGVLLLVLIVAYLLYAYSAPAPEKNKFWTFMQNNRNTLIAIGIVLLVLTIYLIVAWDRGWFPFHPSESKVSKHTKVVAGTKDDSSTDEKSKGTSKDDSKKLTNTKLSQTKIPSRSYSYMSLAQEYTELPAGKLPTENDVNESAGSSVSAIYTFAMNQIHPIGNKNPITVDQAVTAKAWTKFYIIREYDQINSYTPSADTLQFATVKPKDLVRVSHYRGVLKDQPADSLWTNGDITALRTATIASSGSYSSTAIEQSSLMSRLKIDAVTPVPKSAS